VAIDARLSESVLMTSYVKETDEQLRQASNRTFARILASLPSSLARRCGHEAGGDIEERLRQAINARDWELAKSLTTQLARRKPTQVG
jgi:hypothetical protein